MDAEYELHLTRSKKFASSITALKFHHDVKELPDWMKYLQNLEILDLRACTIEEFPEWTSTFTALRSIDLSGCKKLKKISRSIMNLTNLFDLNVNQCSELQSIPSGGVVPCITFPD